MNHFDPYRRWLGIPAGSRPPTHYQLLGISPDEQDRDVIDAAMIRQSAYVRNFQSGKYAEQAARVLNEIAAAKVCLQDPAKRAQYDAELKRKRDATSPSIGPPLPGAQPARGAALPGQAPAWVDLARFGPAPANVPALPSRPISRSTQRLPRTLRPPRRRGPYAWQIAAAAGGVLVLLALIVLMIQGGRPSDRLGGNETADPTGNPPASQPADPSAGTTASPSRNGPAGSSGPVSSSPARPTVLTSPPEAHQPAPPAEDSEATAMPKASPRELSTEPDLTADEAEPPLGPEEPEPPPRRFALRFARQGYVELADSKHVLNLNGDYTIEMWVQWPVFPGEQYLAGDEAWHDMHRQVQVNRPAAGWVLRTRSDGGGLVFDFTVARPQGWISVLSDPVTLTTDWQHVAVSKLGNTIRLFHNGRPIASHAGTDHYIPSPTATYVGPRKFAFANRRFDGFVRAFRLSDTGRYSGEFKPPAEFVDDETTLVLLDFSAGDGREMADLSGNRHHGIISGPAWVEISEPLTNP